MKNIVLLFAVLLYLVSSITTAAAEDPQIQLDLTTARISVTALDTIRMNNVSVIYGEPVPFKIWLDFQWSPDFLVMLPVNVGVEEQKLQWHYGTSTVQYAIDIDITYNEAENTLTVVYSQNRSQANICHGEKITQNGKSFTTSLTSQSSDTVANIQYDNGFNGCSLLQGTVSATIYNLPSWFDARQSFDFTPISGQIGPTTLTPEWGSMY